MEATESFSSNDRFELSSHYIKATESFSSIDRFELSGHYMKATKNFSGKSATIILRCLMSNVL